MKRRRVAALLVALAAGGLAGCGSAVGDGSSRLAVKAPRWWFSRLPVAIDAAPGGILAGRDATVTVSVGSNVAGRWELKKGVASTRIWVPGSSFAVGVNQVLVKTGTERSAVAVQIVSVVWLVALVALTVALVFAIVSQLRKRRVVRERAAQGP